MSTVLAVVTNPARLAALRRLFLLDSPPTRAFDRLTALAAQLLGHDTRPSEAAIRAEIKIRVQEALNGMDAVDREVLALRHFEQLSLAETARVLGLTESGASRRHLRALKRLKEILSGLPGGLDELLP